MKSYRVLNLAFSLAAASFAGVFLTACADDDKFDEAADDAADAAREIRADAASAWDRFSGYSVDKKDEAVDFLETQAGKLDTQIAALKAKASVASDASKKKYAAAIADLEVRRADLGKQLDKLGDATEDTWDSVKRETEEKWNAFTSYLERKVDELD